VKLRILTLQVRQPLIQLRLARPNLRATLSS